MADRISRSVIELTTGGGLTRELEQIRGSARSTDSEFEKLRRRVQDVGGELRRTVEKFSGRALIDEARRVAQAVTEIGGASKLTKAELRDVAATVSAATDKLRRMGEDVPPSIRKLNAEIAALDAGGRKASSGGISSVVGGLGSLRTLLPALSIVGAVSMVTRLGSAALQSADEIVKFSEKTGVSIETTQRWRFAAEQTGTSLDAFANAAFKLGINVGNGTDKVRTAVSGLNLSYADLRAMKPEDQFRTITTALEGVESVTERNRLGTILFGKTWGEIAPAVSEGISEIAASAKVASDANVRAAERAGDAWGRFQTALNTGVITALGGVAVAIDDIERAADSMTAGEKLALFAKGGGNPTAYLASLKELGKGIREAAAEQEAANKAWAALPERVGAASGAARDYVGELAALNAEVKRLRTEYGAQLDAALKVDEVSQDLADQFHTTEDALRIYQSTVKSTSSSLESADNLTAQWNDSLAKNAEKAKEAEKELKAWIRATNTKIEFGGDKWTDMTKLLEQRFTAPMAKAIIENAQRHQKYQTDLTTLVQSQTMTRVNFEIAEIERWASNEKAALDRTAGHWEENAALIDAIAKARIDQIVADDTLAQNILFANLETQAKQRISAFQQVLSELGPLVIGAFQGGGDPGKTIGAALGNSIGKSLLGQLGKDGAFSTGLGKMLQGVLGKSLGGALAASVPGALALLGGSLIGKLFGGPSKEILEARKQLTDLQKDLTKTLTAAQLKEAGTEQWRRDVIAVRAAYQAVGRSAAEAEAIVRQMWDTDHPERAAAAIAEINRVLEEQQRILEENQESATDLFDDIMEAGRNGIPASMMPTIERFIELGLLTADQIEQIRGLGEATGPTLEELEDAASTLGTELSNLGPAFRQAQLDREAAKIHTAITRVLSAQGDWGSTMMESRQELGKLVSDARRGGLVLSESLRPYIDDLIASGELIDENGERITDVSGIKWGAAMESEGEKAAKIWDKILEQITRLVDKVAGPLVDAIDEATKDREMKVGIRYEGELPDFEQHTQPVEGNFRTGIFRGQFDPAGTVARLHDVESVVPGNRRDELSFANRVLADHAGGATSTVNTTTNARAIVGVIMQEGRSIADVSRAAAKWLVKEGLAHNVDGTATEFERFIGLHQLSYGVPLGNR